MVFTGRAASEGHVSSGAEGLSCSDVAPDVRGKLLQRLQEDSRTALCCIIALFQA